jgi:RHH-type transcriptional regulator, proline utilization regulon repressor / proline dehydrogenase / delta 1-pyrroline-5-carboxylate dehydrogenase
MFRNEPLTDFSIIDNRARFQNELDCLENKINQGALRGFPIIGGKELRTDEVFERHDPADPTVVVGRTHLASVGEADTALALLHQHRGRWEETPFAERATILQRLARLLREERVRLAALIIREAGKPWREADGDVAEAIDFCEYYAEEMLRLGPPQPTLQVAGEDNFYLYQPRGVAATIAPWNFPLAISCGMTVAALVAGNCTAFKPSEQTSLIGYEFARLVLKAGFPEYAFAFLPGPGEKVGRRLVQSPNVDVICFTGSRTVGMEILSTAATVGLGQSHIKKVVLELGGKNAIVVDEDADLDEAVKGTITSAFGYSGQKCSACSRIIAVGESYAPFLRRFCDAASNIPVGPAKDSSTVLCPVIDAQSQQRILRVIAEAEKDSTIAFKGTVPNTGNYVPVAVFKDVNPSTSLWREEIFGPVVAIRHAASFEEAVALAVDSQYALTGGVFSRSPAHLEYARRKFKVGNLYLNRGCTGALVYRQPFGGFKLSGVGSKAGGPDYLLQFMEPRTITENTMRRGFTPESK